MNPAIKSKLDEFKARRERATPGPWTTKKCRDGIYAERKTLVTSDSKEVVGVRQLGYPQVKEVEENADFIAASRTEHAQLEASLRVALDALAVYSDKSTYHIMDYGRNYVSNLVVEDYDSDKPIEDRAKEALERIAKILEAK